MTHQLVLQLAIAYTLVGAFVFTVVVTCLSLVGLVKFAIENQQKRLFQILIVELVIICVTFFAGFIEFDPKLVAETAKLEEAKKIRYTVNVLDQLNNAGVDTAALSLEVGAAVIEASTDRAGVYTFSLNNSLANQPAVLRVTKAGYRSGELANPLPSTQGTVSVRLAQTTPPVPAPAASAPSRVVDVAIFTSEPLVSGSMENFSPWYELCSGALPPGSIIEQVTFTLAGDRSCGAWAECREKERTQSRVCWQFRMQGHNEWLPPGQARSVGQLRVQFSRPGA